jgi:hypothetical protein
MSEPMNAPDLVDIDFDLDRYITDGGKLSEIRFVSPARALEWARTVPAEISSSRLERWGRYCGEMAKTFPSEDKVGERLSEDDLQRIWKDAA